MYKHNISLKYESKRNSKELSNLILGKKKEKGNVSLDGSILGMAKPYSEPSKKCMRNMPYREISHHFFYKESVEWTQWTWN